MAIPSQVIAALLLSKGVGTSIEANANSTLWTIKYGRRTDSPDNLIVLTDTGGSNPNTKYRLDFKHVQALVRAASYEYLAGMAKAHEVKDALLGIDSQNVVVGSETIRVDGITMNGDVAFLRYDEVDRPLFAVNMRIIMEPPSNALTNRDSL